jgi:serralysin
MLSGGAGNDTLNGLAGVDSFLFKTALNAATNVDTIVNFSTVSDKVLLENSIFTAVGAPGTLAASAFFIGSVAHDADDRIIYTSGTGALRYDPDGNGGAAATQFATLSIGLALTNTNFQIV